VFAANLSSTNKPNSLIDVNVRVGAFTHYVSTRADQGGSICLRGVCCCCHGNAINFANTLSELGFFVTKQFSAHRIMYQLQANCDSPACFVWIFKLNVNKRVVSFISVFARGFLHEPVWLVTMELTRFDNNTVNLKPTIGC